MFHRASRHVALLCLALLLSLLPTPGRAADRPQLSLPTPPGETWKVIQGYNCGSHNGWGRLSFDLVNAKGRTRGAPVYAAADGTFWYWGAHSGTLIISHGAGYYTMYTHMQSVTKLSRGASIKRGTQVGTVGSVGADYTVPHLHFTFFYAEGRSGSNRRPLPLSFVEGYNFPDEGKCNNHGGALVVAGGTPASAPAPEQSQPAVAIEWQGSPQATWLSAGRVDWLVRNGSGFSQAWDVDPGGDTPQFVDATAGYVELSLPGVHTLYVRAWDRSGNQVLSSYEVWYDPNPPSAPVASSGVTRLSSKAPVALTWQPAQDELSGVAGYQVYLGPDVLGTSDWFVTAPELKLSPLGPGRYYLRVRTQDQAGNFSAWTTVEVLEVQTEVQH